MLVGLHWKRNLTNYVRSIFELLFFENICEMYIGLQGKIPSNEGIKRNLIVCVHIF